VIVTLLIVGGVEQNPGPLSEQEEKEIFEFTKNTGKKENDVKGTLEIIQMSLSALQSAINLVSTKLEKNNKAVKDLTDSMTSIQMTVNNVKLRLEQCKKKVTEAQVDPKRNNLIISGLDEEKNESHSTTFGILEKFLKEKMDIEIAEWHVDMANRLGRGRGNRLIMVRFTTCSKKLEILENMKKLAGSKIRIEQDYTWETRQIRRDLIPYLKEARNKGHRAVIKIDKLIVNSRLYKLKYLKENIKFISEDKIMVTPGNGSRDRQDMNQQFSGVSRLNHQTSQHVTKREENNGIVGREEERRDTAHQDQLCEGVVGGVLKGGEEKDRMDMGSDGTLARQRENESNEEREVEILSSPQGNLIQIEKRRLKADQRDLNWWMRSTSRRGGEGSGREGGTGHCD
jgi:hypothetical protein